MIIQFLDNLRLFFLYLEYGQKTEEEMVMLPACFIVDKRVADQKNPQSFEGLKWMATRQIKNICDFFISELHFH